MLLEKRNRPTKKTVSYRADRQLLDEFKELTKKHGYMQITIIENAMREVVRELREVENKKDDR